MHKKKVVCLLKKARNFLGEKSNWCQGKLYNGRGQYCALGSLWWADGVPVPESRERSEACSIAAHELSETSRAIYHKAIWCVNDENGLEPTLEMFDKTIARLEQSNEV
jgi:hypothetical protein